MWTLGPLGFSSPLLLIALIALPVLWLLLRAVPPTPIRRRFPGVALLLGLNDEQVEADKTPWWLLLLRALAIGAAIIAFAGPVLNPRQDKAGTGPLLILMDASWADARDWPRRIDRASALVDEAGRAGRTVAVVRLTDAPQPVAFQAANAWSGRMVGLAPQPFAPVDLAAWVAELPEGGFDSFWLSDGLDHPGQGSLLSALQGKGAVTVFNSPRPIIALRPAAFEDGAIKLQATRLPAADASEIEVLARGLDPSGVERELARAKIAFSAGANVGDVSLSLPPELRNRISRFEVAGVRSAGAVSLTDDSLKRRKIALIAGSDDLEGLQLLSPTHYLKQALEPVAELINGNLSDILLANPDVIVLADVARLSPDEETGILEWAEKGGLLLRFAGPRLAASDVSRDSEDPLMPVRLREGGRSVGGAMSWGEPRALAPFNPDSPFFGLTIPADVTVASQVLAQPDPDLASRTIAALADGTPLVTRRAIGQGQVVLVHVTANADWSTLPLSGLFVQMLERLAVSTRPAAPEASDLEGQIWTPEVQLNAYGVPSDAQNATGVDGVELAKGLPGPGMLPGLYAGDDRRVALNVIGAQTTLTAATWPAGVAVEGLDTVREQPLKGGFLAAGLGLLLIDILAALWLSGRLWLGRAGRVGVQGILLALAVGLAQQAHAQGTDAADKFAIEATSDVRLAYVMTDDAKLNKVAEAGLTGLGLQLFARTTVEPGPTMEVNIEADELAFFPFLYWPVTASQPIPSAKAYAKLNAYLRSGGMIMFDTRDAGIGAAGSSPEARRLQLIASPLDIPPLEPLPGDHVLTRTFYLLQDFPGRQTTGTVWVEAAPPDAAKEEGVPFRHLNDGVTPVVIASNDYASAWAVNDAAQPMFPVGRGYGGERQRETSYRFGINLIMYVLTGNYKSDQVHVPDLLERLGQ